jgi:predicted metal-binding membrane protein
MVITAQPRDCGFSRRVAPDRVAPRAFPGISALLFVVSVPLTTLWCKSMSAMGGMAMPGGWTMSMAWMRMPGQTWAGAAASFAGMWIAMMAAMMLPSLAPALWRHCEGVRRAGETCPGRLTALVGIGYLLVWTMLGMVVFPLGAALATVEMRQRALARAVPMAAGMVVLMAGTFQFTSWKAHHLACCREWPGHTLTADAGAAWRHGLRLGVHCSYGCAGLTTILLVIGIMDLRAMAVVTAAITAERVAPAGERVARGIGAIAVSAGLFLIARAAVVG